MGALFFVVMLGSYFVEKWYINRDLDAGKMELLNQGLANAQEIRDRNEKYIADLLKSIKAKIEAQVYELDTYIPLEQTFVDQGAAWVSSATYIATTMWIELIQIGSNENMTSLVIMKNGALNHAGIVHDASGLTLCHMNGRQYVGVPIQSKDVIERSIAIPQELTKKDSVFYALYTPQDILRHQIGLTPLYLFSFEADPLQTIF